MILTFKDQLSGKWVRIQADNRSLYFIASKGSSSCLAILNLLVRLFWLCSEYNIRWDIIWLPRELNQWADDLSKEVDQDDWSVDPRFWAVIQSRFGPFTCDMFASGKNALLEAFCALYWCPGVSYVDCFSGSWSVGILWWHPNPGVLGNVLRKIKKDRARLSSDRNVSYGGAPGSAGVLTWSHPEWDGLEVDESASPFGLAYTLTTTPSPCILVPPLPRSPISPIAWRHAFGTLSPIGGSLSR
jgi:hypothetical protein